MALTPFSTQTFAASDGAQQGGVGARFAELYRDNFAFVWRTAKRLGVRESHQDDVVQEVFLIVHRKLDAFEGRSSLRTWLYGITIRVVRDHRKSRALRDEPTGLDFDALATSAESPARELERAEAARMLHAILDSMDEEKREVFVLSELEQLSIPDAAEALSVNVNTAYARLRAAKQIFESAVSRLRARDARRES